MIAEDRVGDNNIIQEGNEVKQAVIRLLPIFRIIFGAQGET